MDIAYRDFERKARGILWMSSEPMGEVVARAEDWVGKQGAEVVYLEPLTDALLDYPVLADAKPTGVRVYYREPA
jgi:hypothetical protein